MYYQNKEKVIENVYQIVREKKFVFCLNQQQRFLFWFGYIQNALYY